MRKLNIAAMFLTAQRNWMGRAIWKDLFGPSWGEADIDSLGERGMRDVGVVQTRYGIDTVEEIAPDPARRLH